MHFMEPLKAVEENNSKLAHDADIGKETTSNTNALSKAGIPWSSNKNPPVETKDTPNPDLLEYTPLPETKEQKSKSSGIPKNRLENINKKEVKSYFDILALQGLVRCSQPSKFFDPNSEEEKKQKEIIKKGAFGFSSKRGKNGAFNTTPPVEFDKRIEIKPRTENNNKDLEIVRENFETSDTPTLPKNSASISESGLGCLSTESQNLIQQRESGANDQMKIRPCEIEQKVLDKASNNAHEGSQAQQIEVRNTTGLPKHDQEGQTISKNDANTVEIIEDPSKLIVSNEGSEVKLTNSQTTSKSIQISAQVVPEHEILTDQSPNQHLLQEQIQNSSVRNEDD